MFQNTSLETLKISQSGYSETFVNSSRGPWKVTFSGKT